MTFESGTSGNPNGRPKGTGSRQKLFNTFVEPHREKLFNKAVELALAGNEAMLKLLLDRMLPAKPKCEPLQIELSEADFNNPQAIYNFGQQALKSVASGEITTDEAAKIASLAAAHTKIYEIIYLSEELEDLKKLQISRNLKNGIQP